MKLSELKSKPKLIKVVVDTDLVVEAYGEPVEFWMYDRQDLPTFLRLANVSEDQASVMELVRDLVLDENGKPVLEQGEVLPIEILMAVIEAMVQNLGNFKSQTSQV